MVKGVSQLHSRFARIPQKVREEVTIQLEKEAKVLVKEMTALKPIPEISIDWTWGDAPRGAVSIGRVAGNQHARIAITIYATGKGGEFPALASWFEFGTKDRHHKSGKWTGRITASPYFFPTYRSNRKRIRSNLSRAVTRGVRKA